MKEISSVGEVCVVCCDTYCTCLAIRLLKQKKITVWPEKQNLYPSGTKFKWTSLLQLLYFLDNSFCLAAVERKNQRWAATCLSDIPSASHSLWRQQQFKWNTFTIHRVQTDTYQSVTVFLPLLLISGEITSQSCKYFSSAVHLCGNHQSDHSNGEKHLSEADFTWESKLQYCEIIWYKYQKIKFKLNTFLLTITIEAGLTVDVLHSEVVHLFACAGDLVCGDIRT